MDNSIDDLTKQIQDNNIDIKALNEFIQEEENEEFQLNENGEIMNKISNESIIKKILNFIMQILIALNFINEKEEKNICGIINVGNTCYINAGLQILSRCYPLIKELLQSNYENNELIKLFLESTTALLFKKDKNYNPTKFLESFCEMNKDFNIGQPNCSQDFIRTMIGNINAILDKNKNFKKYNPNDQNEKDEYEKYIEENKIFPESKAYSIFSGILKVEINCQCNKCNEEIYHYSFGDFVDQILYLDSFSTKCKFKDVLDKNIGQSNKVSMNCPKCKNKICCKSISKFIKIPEIFIFTLERYLVRNKVPVEPDEYINIHDLVDSSLKISKDQCNYELFAINIRLGDDLSFGHEICQIKQDNKWYTINDGVFNLKDSEYYEYSYGLFYRRIYKTKKNK